MLIRSCGCALSLVIALSAVARLPLERAIEQGEVHEELLDLRADSFVALEIEQIDIDLDAAVLDPAGAEVVKGALEYNTRLSFISCVAGPHRLVLKPMKESSRLGTVRIALLESRPARPEDRQRLEAQQSFYEAVMLLREQTASAATRAIVPLERALAQWRALGDCHSETWAMYALAAAHGTKGDRTLSLKLFDDALARQRELGDLRGMTGSLRAKAGLLFRTDPQRARPLAEEALALSRALGYAAAQAEARNHLGLMEGQRGEHRAAIAHYEEALEISRRIGNPFQEALFTSNIAVSLASLGEWRPALAYFDRAVPIYRSVGDKHELANTLQNTGAAYVWLGDYRGALEQFRLALPIIRETGNRRLEAINRINTGVANLELGQRAGARAALEEGLALARGLEDLRQEAIALRHLARLDEKEGKLKPALAQHEQSLVLNQVIGNPRGEAFALLNIGSLQRKLGDADAARRSIRAAHALACDVEDPALDSATRLALARVEAQTGNLDAAWRQLDAAMHGVESLRVSVAGQHLRGAYQLTLREYYDLSVDVLMRLHRQRPREGFDALALQTAERARARGLLDLLAEARVDVRQGGDPELLAKEKKLRRAINDKAAQLARASKKNLAAEVETLVSELRRVEAQIRASSSRYASLTQPVPLTVREIQRSVLDDETVLIEIALGEERGYLWAVAADSVTVHELPPRREVESIARRFYDALTARNTRTAGESSQARLERLATAKTRLAGDGARLYDLLLGQLPLRGRTRLLVVADGALQYIPFAALPARDGQPLVTRFEIISMPSVSALAALRRETAGRRAPQRMVAVLADPIFGDPRLPRLPLTREEAASIARVASDAEVRVGSEATRAAAMSKDLSRFRYIHFATHGIIDDRNPELSALALSDGYLRLHDIYNLELPAELVVLSACQTALGKEVAHEGLVGLTRGFMYAGAERVLASLWKIDDRSTAELMRRFYERMLVGRMTPAAALRAAQVEMAKSALWSDPYHWAAFVLQGEWRATPADVERVVDEAVAAPLREKRFSGVVLVRHQGRTLVRKAYGMADDSAGRLNTPATRFMIMSVSKQLTAALILRLIAQGRLGLRDRVSDYLADWPSEWDAVTVQDLLSHSAGTDVDTTYFWLIKQHPQYWPNPSEPPPGYEPRPLLTEPGTTFVYSNVGYTLLSLIAAIAGGKPFDELMREEVFCPLGMTDTQPERGSMVAGRARGHRKTSDGVERSEQGTIDIVGAGDLVSTVNDLARYDEALDDDRFLPSALRAAMFTRHPPQKKWAAGWGPLLRSSEIGYGWFLRTMSDGTAMQFHTGSGAGFRALNFRIPQSSLVIVVLNNIGTDGPPWISDLVERIHAAIAAK